MRNLLLKYVLRIEEDIKTIFCTTLNDEKLDSNFLLDINNYNVSDDKSITTIIKILQKHQNKYSNPINRKKSQNIIPPFWILINELTLGELIHTISALKDEYKTKIIDNLVIHFTIINTPNGRDRNALTNLISDISRFRNDLAHNNPVFQYNVGGNCLSKFPKVKFVKPKVKNAHKLTSRQFATQKNNRKQQIQSDLKRFWNSDVYNTKSVSKLNIDLSYILYLVYRITKHINPSTDYVNNVHRLFTKYGMFQMGSWGTTLNYERHTENIDILKEINKSLLSLNGIKTRHLTDKKDFKKIISDMKIIINENRLKIKTVLSTEKTVPDKIKLDPFPYISTYTKYTGIDISFLNDVLI